MKIFTLHFRLHVTSILFAALLAVSARAAAANYDFNPDSPFRGDLPAFVGAGSSPVYITNTNDAEARGEASVDSLRVGQRGSLNIGFDADRAASAPVALGVAGDMSVEGGVRVGVAGERAAWLPAGSNGYAAGLNVGGALSVARGGEVLVEGGMDEGAGRVEHSGVVAQRIDVNGGGMRINPSGELHARDAMLIRNGGRVVVDAGLPPRDADEMTGEGDWAFKGLGLGAGGLDIRQAGLLQAGENGATVDGSAGTTAIRVQRGGYLDVSQNDMLARGIGEIAVDGTYRAGVGSELTSENGGITFGAEAKPILSTDLYRQINTTGVAESDSIARARNIDFANGRIPALRSGMGFYDLAVVPFADDGTGRSGEELRVVGASRTVSGDGTAADRTQFHNNLNAIGDSPMTASQAEAMYDLLAARYPAIEAAGESGAFNRDVLESLMNGAGTGIPARGIADRGVAELYNGGAQWGANTAAYNTAELFMAGLDRRVQRIGAELDRLGHEEFVAQGTAAPVASDSANSSLLLSGLLPPGSLGGDGRIWKGAVYARDEAEPDSGIAGYKYDPKGLLLGYDKTLGKWSLGGAASFARGDFEDKAATTDNSGIDSYSAGLFAAYHGDDGFNASAFATMSVLDNTMDDTRGGMRREADFTSRAWSAGARLGYDMRLSDRLIVQPSAGLTHINARTNSHDESLDGIEVMRVGEIDRAGTLIPVDLTLGYDLLRNFDSLLRLNAGLGYAYDIGASAPEGTLSYAGLAGAPDVDIIGREPGKHRLSAGIGLLYTRERFDFSARYDYVRRDAQTAHQANTRLGIKF